MGALWLRIQGAVFMALAVLAVLAGAYGMGSRAARRSAETDQALAERKLQRKSNEIDRELAKMGTDRVLADSRRWVRGEGGED